MLVLYLHIVFLPFSMHCYVLLKARHDMLGKVGLVNRALVMCQ